MLSKIEQDDLQTILRSVSEYKQDIKGRKYLITGGGGFIGSWICDTLYKLGGNIICVDNFSSGSERNIEHLIGKKRFYLHKCDISKDFNSAFDLVLFSDVNYVIHLGARASPKDYQEHPIETLDVSYIGTKNCLEFASQTRSKFLFASTSEIYGSPPIADIPTNEEYWGNVNPHGYRSMYDEGKRIGETLCFVYSDILETNKNVQVRIARIANTYGPRIDSKFASSGRALIRFIDQGLKGEPITIYKLRDNKGNLGPSIDHTRSFLYITDQVTGLIKLLHANNLYLTDKEDLRVMNIGSETETSIDELAFLIKELTGNKSEVIIAEPNYNIKDDPPRRRLDISRAKEYLNWGPRISLREGLEKTIEWYKSKIY
ncbi:MAG: GDP-mannose 4,6-dehydratase [Candidatus Melainabacteria bacterium]|nr:GDP-mannose 4,6-dehydratase [Candidatus Melainabacteria bacterium]